MMRTKMNPEARWTLEENKEEEEEEQRRQDLMSRWMHMLQQISAGGVNVPAQPIQGTHVQSNDRTFSGLENYTYMPRNLDEYSQVQRNLEAYQKPTKGHFKGVYRERRPHPYKKQEANFKDGFYKDGNLTYATSMSYLEANCYSARTLPAYKKPEINFKKGVFEERNLITFDTPKSYLEANGYSARILPAYEKPPRRNFGVRTYIHTSFAEYENLASQHGYRKILQKNYEPYATPDTSFECSIYSDSSLQDGETLVSSPEAYATLESNHEAFENLEYNLEYRTYIDRKPRANENSKSSHDSNSYEKHKKPQSSFQVYEKLKGNFACRSLLEGNLEAYDNSKSSSKLRKSASYKQTESNIIDRHYCEKSLDAYATLADKQHCSYKERSLLQDYEPSDSSSSSLASFYKRSECSPEDFSFGQSDFEACEKLGSTEDSTYTKYNTDTNPSATNDTDRSFVGTEDREVVVTCDSLLLYEGDDLLCEGHRYKVMGYLSRGTWGKVIGCRDTISDRLVAIKMFRKCHTQDGRSEIAVLECIMALDHPGRSLCGQMLHSFTYKGHTCIAFARYGLDLYEFLTENKGRHFCQTLYRHMGYQLCVAVNFLHIHDIIHTDLKPSNIVIADPRCCVATNQRTRLDVKLIDFGSAQLSRGPFRHLATTQPYRAPEVLLKQEWSTPIDVWSLGCILLEFFTDGVPVFLVKDEDDVVGHLARMELVLGRCLPRRMLTSRRGMLQAKRATSRLLRLCDYINDSEILELTEAFLQYEPTARCNLGQALGCPVFDTFTQ